MGKISLSKPVQIAIVIICLVGAAFLLVRYFNAPAANSEDGLPDEYHYICANQSCDIGFTWERGQDLGEREYSDTCPECLTPDAPGAAKCDECAHYQILRGHGTYDDPCPECGANMPPLGKH